MVCVGGRVSARVSRLVQIERKSDSSGRMRESEIVKAGRVAKGREKCRIQQDRTGGG